MKGLICDIYKPSTGDFSNFGVSSRFKSVVLTGQGIPEIFEPNENYPEVRLELGGRKGHKFVHRDTGALVRMKAVPVEVGDRWSMFGGCFVYTSDSRFPACSPIHLFDRVEP